MKIVSENEFEEVVKSGITLVDFYATWCGPCRIMANILEDIEDEVGQDVQIVKVDVDENQSLARKFGVMSIPTLIIFKDGQVQEKHIGIWQQEECVETIKSYIK